ncbi:diguanylate cyclase [Pseudohongiella acticola]|jgi:diguanylate cyclase (GGDEF)-like protein|uniref:histidine kinase N-terminal 7TM domain-containing diguanylate cyclase n=1 Tax=Pseudohongiella acticola TaxID=1524254 RepID=UPI0030EE0583
MLFWTIPSLLGTVLSVYMSFYAVKRIPAPTGPYVVALGAAMAWWCAMQWAGLLWHNVEYRYLTSQMQYLGIASVPVLWLSTALSYCGYSAFLSRWYPLLWLVPVLTIAVAFSNELHGLLWSDFDLSASGPGLLIDYGPWFRANTAFSYTMVLAGTVLVAVRIGLAPLYRWRLLTVLVAPTLVLAINLPFVLGSRYLPIDPTPIGFVIAAAVMLMASRRRLFSTVPVARRLTVDNISDGLVVIDNAGNIVDFNPVASKILDVWQAGIGKPLPGELADKLRSDSQGHADIILADGRCLDVRVSDLTTKDDARTGRVILLRDVTQERVAQQKLIAAEVEMRALNEQLQTIANTDELTQLANRRRLYEVLTTEWSRANRYQRPLSIILFDFDHFKRVNDTYGHQVGDEVLKKASSRLSEITRPEDVPARHGGEEFALLLPETDLEKAVEVAIKVHRALSVLEYTDPGGNIFAVTISVGVASKEARDKNQDSLIARADRAMYETKKTGRNGVSMAQGDTVLRFTS